MNILHVFSYISPNANGTISLLRHLTPALARRNHKVGIFTSDFELNDDYIKSFSPVVIYSYHSGLNLKWLYLFFSPAIISVARNAVKDCAIVHLHCLRNLQNVVVYHCARNSTLNIADKVLFTGFLSGDDKLSTLVDANIVVQTSRHEQGTFRSRPVRHAQGRDSVTMLRIRKVEAGS